MYKESVNSANPVKDGGFGRCDKKVRELWYLHNIPVAGLNKRSTTPYTSTYQTIIARILKM